MDWLSYYNQEVVRINGDDFLNESQTVNIYLDPINSYVETTKNPFLNNSIVDLTKSKSVWFRRDSFAHIYDRNREEFKNLGNPPLFDKLNIALYFESIFAKRAAYFLSSLQPKKVLGNFKNQSPNKIETLYLAKTCGIIIPPTVITNKRSDLLDFYDKCKGEIITKSIKDIVSIDSSSTNNEKIYQQYTEAINRKFIENGPSEFFPSLFQKKIKKSYEIRSFYIKGKFYSMAIFSQLDPQTAVDFRCYNQEKSNRNVPFKLPFKVEQNLKKLMDLMDLDTGSIDLVRNISGEYVFLEINPVGQYGMTSAPCNYNLDKIIAEKLI
jgi:ATP-GRASP peptide maturase of grasp-with-spasm system